MPIQLICPQCRSPFVARDESAGRRVKCPACGAVLAVPATGSGLHAPPAGVQTPEPAGVPGPRRAAPSGPSLTPLSPDEREELRITEEPPKPPAFKIRAEDERARRPVPPPETKTATGGPPPLPEDEVRGWLRVRRGLGRVQFAAFLFFLVVLVNFGRVFLVPMFAEEYVDNPPPGNLNLGMNLIEEIDFLALAGLGGLGALLLLFGRLAAASAPRLSGGGGRSLGSAFWTLIAFGGLGLAVASDFVPEVTMPWLPAATVGFMVFLIAGLMAEMLFLNGVSGMGGYLGAPKVVSCVGGTITLAGFAVLVLFLGTIYQEIGSQHEKFPDEARDWVITVPEDPIREPLTAVGVGTPRVSENLFGEPIEGHDRPVMTGRTEPFTRSAGVATLGVIFSFLLLLSYNGALGRLRRTIKARLPERA